MSRPLEARAQAGGEHVVLPALPGSDDAPLHKEDLEALAALVQHAQDREPQPASDGPDQEGAA